MDWDFEDIPRLADEMLKAWIAKHPDYNPSFTGCKMEFNDQTERDRCMELEPCLIWVNNTGYKHQVPSVRFKLPTAYQLEREMLKQIYDERQF